MGVGFVGSNKYFSTAGDKGIRRSGDALCSTLEEERGNGRVGEWVSVSLAQINNSLLQVKRGLGDQAMRSALRSTLHAMRFVTEYPGNLSRKERNDLLSL